jgi:hypothetical protein
MFTGLRVAIVHDWLQGFHGSERVVAAMAEDVFESADAVDIHTYFRSLDLSSYDVVVASSHSCAIQARPRAGAAHVCFSHTPMRFVERFSDHVAGVLNGDREPVPL